MDKENGISKPPLNGIVDAIGLPRSAYRTGRQNPKPLANVTAALPLRPLHSKEGA